ncbi:MAG: pyridoxal phosphate-dependent aminotransferase [Chitinophagaceae bacterium]
MTIPHAKRLKGINEYYFSKKLREVDLLIQAGKPIISLGIGGPDMPPHPSVIESLYTEAQKDNTHSYQNYQGSPFLRKAFVDFYYTHYGVSLNPDTELLILMGSKEGIMHVCMAFLNAGDEVLVPNPGYPTYRSAVTLAEGKCREYTLEEKNDWLPDFDALEKTDLSKVKLMWVNYPHMPTGTIPSLEVFQKLVAFAKKHHLLLCHDNPYSFINNPKPMSLLCVEGAKDITIEINSLSKSHNMAGWRVGMLASNKNIVQKVLQFKSNMDSGMFFPLQLAATKALSLPQTWYEELNQIYTQRRKKIYQILDLLNCNYDLPQAGLFGWAKVPSQYKDGYALSDFLLYEKNIFTTPGGIFGTMGKDYIRLSLCQKENKIDEVISRLK